MFSCPGCGGNLRFDIPSQQMKCEFCSNTYDPYEFDSKQSDAEERQDFEVTVFTCPQCGGEILSTDNTAAGFCSFCGASTVLYSRISREKRPAYIIPFLKSKEDCKQSYAALMKKAIFSPRELKDPAKIDSFRGIYMPYWTYYVTQRGPVELKASRSKRRGDYIITDHFRLTGDLDAYYKGFSHDASASFDDDISEAIAPYDVKGMKSFTPAFFSGFYADTADVPEKRYRKDAIRLAVDESAKRLVHQRPFSSYTIDTTIKEKTLNTKVEQVDSSMFPVWFMSYRNGDRVAYATVNGQTGRLTADLPIAKWKYYLGTLILALPIFAILTLLLTLTPLTLLAITSVVGLFSGGICIAQRSLAKKHEGRLTGFLGRSLGLICTAAALVLGVVVFLWEPVSDLWYYGCVLAQLLSIVVMFTDIIYLYNIRSTRRLPQFDRRGGDDRA